MKAPPMTPKRQQIKDALRGFIRERLDVKIALKKYEIEMLKKEFEREQRTVEDWEKDKDSFIERKVKDLTGEYEGEAPF